MRRRVCDRHQVARQTVLDCISTTVFSLEWEYTEPNHLTMKYHLLLLLILITGCVPTNQFKKEQALVVNESSGFYLGWGIITANHVTAESDQVVIKDATKEFTGVVVMRDTLNDLCYIKYANPKYYDFEIGSVNTRDKVYSVSNPFGLYFSELSGEVQSIDREENGQWRIQIGIDVYYGSSGSAVYNGHGRIVGMIVEAVPGTRFTIIVPANQILLFFKRYHD